MFTANEILIMKNLKSLGKALTKVEQRTINGGKTSSCPPEHRHAIGLYCMDNGDSSFDEWKWCMTNHGCLFPVV